MSNKFITDCLAELVNNAKARERFNKQGVFIAIDGSNIITGTNSVSFLTREPVYRFDDFQNLWETDKIYIIQTLLSTTPNGQAVMPFLDVESKQWNEWKNERFGIEDLWYHDSLIDLLESYDPDVVPLLPKTLRQILLQEFTRVCFDQGQGFDKALEAINLIYLQYV